jgi:periplasmic protein TonB
VHAGAVVALLLTVRPLPKPSPPTYAVELVAAPATAGAARPAPEATPPPAPAPVVPKTPPKAAPRPKPAPVKAPPKAQPKPAPAPSSSQTKSASRTAGATPPLPGETPGTGRDLANVKLAGKEFPYPEYLRNLVAQIYRRWNRPAGDAALTAEVGFVILRDGTVKDIVMVTKSRSYNFDLEAQGAIEAAASVKAFGPLPAGYAADYLQISFLFTPRQVP